MEKQSEQTEGIVKGNVGAYTVTFNNMVAMKQLRIAKLGRINEYFHKMAAKELEIIQKVSEHSNIIKLYELLGVTNPEKGTENCHLVMELCQLQI